MRLNSSKTEVLNLFFDNPGEELYLSQISDKLNLSLDTVHRSLHFWKEKGVLRCRSVGRTKLYSLVDCELTKAVKRLMEAETNA